MGTILVGRVRFWKGLVSFKSARRLMVTDGLSDETDTRDAYASKNLKVRLEAPGIATWGSKH